MGLDNGLIIKPKTDKGAEYLSENFDYLKNKYSSDIEYEFFYARKCWNIRYRFFEYNLGYDADHRYLKIADLVSVVNDVLKYFLNEDNWDRSESIWDWEVQVPHIAEAIKNLRFLIKDVEYGDISDEDLEIYFYDSY